MYNDCTRQPLDNHVPVNLHVMQGSKGVVKEDSVDFEEEKLGGGAHQGQSDWSRITGATGL
ncbi:hypothetical protein BY996DRAFT_8397785 [Phakopsora pachyrhizi]|nr:hypothetical protein BY996DRAFT_8397785 [Phakopsora pachyrhizi]